MMAKSSGNIYKNLNNCIIVFLCFVIMKIAVSFIKINVKVLDNYWVPYISRCSFY